MGCENSLKFPCEITQGGDAAAYGMLKLLATGAPITPADVEQATLYAFHLDTAEQTFAASVAGVVLSSVAASPVEHNVRLIVPATAFPLAGRYAVELHVVEVGGAQRWLTAEVRAHAVFAAG
ncbi:MAG: hypothetical protein WD294_14920 [Phycisphaeraceae bacterium]